MGHLNSEHEVDKLSHGISDHPHAQEKCEQNLNSWKDHIEYGKDLELGKEWDKKIVFKKKFLK